MNRYHYGIKNPTEKDWEIAKHEILESSVNLEDLDSADTYLELQDVLRAANTIINYHKQQKSLSTPATMSLTQNHSTGRSTQMDSQPEFENGISMREPSPAGGHLLKSREIPHTSAEGLMADDPWKWTVDHVANHCSGLMVQMSEDERDRFRRQIQDQGVNGSTLLCDIYDRNLLGVFKLKTFGARAIILREVEDLQERSIIYGARRYHTTPADTNTCAAPSARRKRAREVIDLE